ncbi:MAG TPA: hypothetical protein VHA56_19770 [Mucilaginibacter sp.]|nr:hypothetical protein [Mucilaginibacter sp.]
MINFIRYQSSQLFVIESADAGDSGYLAYFLSELPDPVPETISINQSWYDYTGFYVFLREAPATGDMDKFVTAVTDFFTEQYANPLYTGFAWINYDSLSSAIVKSTVVTAAPAEEKVHIGNDVSFTFGHYAVPFKTLAPIVPVTDQESNIVSFTYEYPPYEGAPPPRQGFNVQIPFAGDKRGSLIGQVSLGDFSDDANTGANAALYYVVNYNKEVIAQRYPLFDTGGAQGLQVLFNYVLDPVDELNPDRSYLAFSGTMFFLSQNDEGQWQITANAQNALPSFFRTIYGRKVSLIPVTTGTNPAKFVFEELPPVGGEARYYLAPAGDFELMITGSAEKAGVISDFIICGLSGAESVKFVSKSKDQSGDVMRFVPKQNAYAPVYPIISHTLQFAEATAWTAARAGEVFTRQRDTYLAARKAGNAELLNSLQATTPLLNGTYKTSWVNIRPGESSGNVPVYYSQPNDAALYDHEGVNADVTNELLQLRNTPAAVFPDQVTQSVPMVSYAGVADNAQFGYTEIQQFESQIILPARREAVSSIAVEVQASALKMTDTLITTTTPQGLLAKVPDAGLNWQSVLLAKSESRGIAYDLEFNNGVTKELRDVLQSNQLFMVASEAEPLGSFSNKITIADWPFTINVGKGSDQGAFSNILIFKFAEGAIEDRVKDPQSWASAATFNKNATLVSKWISAYIETAKLNVKTDPRYANFLQIVQNPRWNGILALKVDIGVENFPDDLKGLLAGINRNEFYAHHFGIEINFIKPDTSGELTLPKSSLFGLINYVDKDYRATQDINAHMASSPFIFNVQETPSAVPPAQELYSFKVLTLQVVFENSEIKDFTSKIQLTTTAWFDEPAQINVNNMGSSLRNQTIEFDGSYEKHNGVNTYTFVTRPDQSYKFVTESQTLNYVEIIKAQFYTLTDQNKQTAMLDGSADTENISSRFVFWGYMNFQLVESFDLYSFGDKQGQQDTHNQGLYFANLFIGMDFVLDNISGEASDRTFNFDPHKMSFDVSLSTPRSNSLFTNFPINLSGIMYSKRDDESKPADLGYLPIIIQSPTAIKAQSLTDRWYALLYNLNLGSMGALAAKAGFVSQISTAWSPDTLVRRLSTGIKLPGVGGQKTLSLQSVLNISIQSFTFYSAYDEVDTSKLAYLLKFNNVKLSLLGMKLPGAADTQFILFGDSTGVDKTTLAWYAAYYLKKPTPPANPPGVPPVRPPVIASGR